MDLALQQALARLLAALRREDRQQSGLDPQLVPSDKATACCTAVGGEHTIPLIACRRLVPHLPTLISN